MARMLIKNGLVVSATGSTPLDVLVDGQTIAAVGGVGYFANVEPTCDK